MSAGDLGYADDAAGAGEFLGRVELENAASEDFDSAHARAEAASTASAFFE